MRKVFDAYRNSLGLKMLALYTWSASIFSRVYVTHTHIQNFKFDLNIQPNKSNHDNIIKLILLIINVDHYKLEKIK